LQAPTMSLLIHYSFSIMLHCKNIRKRIIVFLFVQ
jgi:hypothetical protein